MPGFGPAQVQQPSGLTTRGPSYTIDTQRSRRNSNDAFFTTFLSRVPGGLADQSARAIPELAARVRSLQGMVEPGQGYLSQRSREAGRQAVGNLRDTLARRRIRGSSFAQNEMARQQRENQLLEQEAFEAELERQAQLIGQEGLIRQQGFEQALAEASIASGQATALAQLFNQAEATNAQLEQAFMSGIGELIGTAAGVGTFAATGGFGGTAAPLTPTTLPTPAPGSFQQSGRPFGINNPAGFSFI